MIPTDIEKFHTTSKPDGFVVSIMVKDGRRYFDRFGVKGQVLTAWCLAGAAVLDETKAKDVAAMLVNRGKVHAVMTCQAAMDRFRAEREASEAVRPVCIDGEDDECPF